MTGGQINRNAKRGMKIPRLSQSVSTACCLVFLACLVPPPAPAQTTAETPRPQIQAEDIPQARIPGDYLSWNIPPEARSAITNGLKAGDYELVESTLVKLVEQDPKSPQLLTFLARIFFIDNKPLNCAIALKKAERLEPLKEPDQFILALSYVTMKRRDWASQEFEKLAQSNPRNALYPYWQGRIAYDNYSYPAAIEKFNKALELDPEFPRAYDNLGLCYEAMSNDESAMKYYERAVILNRKRIPASPWPPLNYGMLLVKQGSLGQAEIFLREAVNLGPGMPLTHYQLGVALGKQERFSDAIDELKKAAELDPTYPEAHFTLAHVYRQLGDRERADMELSAFQKLKQAQKDRKDAAGSGQVNDKHQ
jgi:tetratricopeptide (TPR) repeat protein